MDDLFRFGTTMNSITPSLYDEGAAARRLAKAHGLTLGDYLEEVARRVVRGRPAVRAAS